ncbi:MAG TPA: IPT/TIG domain-containing protein [Polyangia bacterium]|nr:IPT/TIG domain-containing protein [Polyangia bacterium]
MKRVRLAVTIGSLALLAACQQSGGPLKVEALEPNQGTTGGGDEVAIIGGGFQPGKTQAEVKFGRKKVESVVIASNSKIKVITPANEKGPVDITVMFDDGSTFKIPNAFRYVEPSDSGSARRAFFSGGEKGPAAPGKIEIEKK